MESTHVDQPDFRVGGKTRTQPATNRLSWLAGCNSIPEPVVSGAPLAIKYGDQNDHTK
jgi:hypothetical protein